MEAVKQSFPLSKIVFTIHDMGWTTRLLGDVDKYKEVILKRRQRKIKDTYEYILDYFDEERRMYAIADKVVCLSQDTHNLLIDTYKVEQSKIHLIPNGSRDIFTPVLESEIAFLKEDMHIPKNEKIILYVGRLTEVKGCFVLLNCFKKVLEQYQNCRLVMAGTMQNSLPILELSSAFATRVSFTGLINRNELRKWYQIADIGIIPSFSEQSSYTAIEMMMYRLAIVSTNGYGLKNMFNNRKNALTVEVQRGENIKKYEENFTNAILEVLNNENLSQTLKTGARKTFLTKFEQKYMRANYINLFDY
jgi:glycosyltransferase involved in cell wall biosynthesis